MKKQLIILSILLSSFFCNYSYGDSSDEYVKDIIGFLSDGDFGSIYDDVKKVFGGNMYENEGTRIVTYHSRHSETIQIAWFSDGYVVTNLGGDKKGYQVVIWNDEIVGISYPSEIRGKDLTNQYWWGSVSCDSHLVEIKGISNIKNETIAND